MMIKKIAMAYSRMFGIAKTRMPKSMQRTEKKVVFG